MRAVSPTRSIPEAPELRGSFLIGCRVARVGELLVALGWITRAECLQALQAQVQWGGTLGTNLVQLGCLDLDQLSRALAHQHQLPAALARHFDAADPILQQALGPDLADRFACLPLWIAGDRVVVAATAPLDARARDLVGRELGWAGNTITLAIAAELRIRYQLERTYQIARTRRSPQVRRTAPGLELRPVEVVGPEPALPGPRLASGSVRDQPPLRSRLRTDPLGLPVPPARPVASTPPPGRLATPPSDVVTELARQVTTAAQQRAPTRDRRVDPPREAALGRVPLKRITRSWDDPVPIRAPMSLGTAPPPISVTLGEATRAIRRGDNRETIAQLVIQTVAQFVPSTQAALMLTVAGPVAIAHAGFSRVTATLPEVAVPLDRPGLIARVIESKAPARGAAADLGAIDFRVLSALGTTDDDLVVLPISAGTRVVGLIALATRRHAALASAESITAAAGAAFGRLARDAER
jgi:hypothetical protein